MLRNMLPALCIVAAVGCGVSKEEFAAQQRDAQQNLKKYQEESEKRTALEKEIADLQQRTTALQQQLAELSARSAKLQEEKGALEAKSAQYQQLASTLQSQIASGQVEISELRGKMTVKLRDRVLFSSGSASLNKEGKAALDAVADAFKDLKGKNVVVSGYTDDVPISNVVRYLQTKGVSPAMLGAAGFSEYRPLVPNDSAGNRSQNRRIEIALTAADYSPPVVDVPK